MDFEPKERDYEAEAAALEVTLSATRRHPLADRRSALAADDDDDDGEERKSRDKSSKRGKKKWATAKKKTKKKKLKKKAAKAFADPLLGGDSADGVDDPLMDPLSALAGGASSSGAAASTGTWGGGSAGSSGGAAHPGLRFDEADSSLASDVGTTPWRVKKEQILQDYALTGKIRVKADFMTDVRGTRAAEAEPKVLDKTQKRLDMLEGKDGDDSTEITQKQLIERVELLHSELQGAWGRAERVLALKLAIQTAKLLADPDVPQFYPSMFVLATEVLDTFGTFVFNRLKAKALEVMRVEGGPPPTLPPDFSARHIPSPAKETCRNWFYKTACIRELLPRLYIEIALLRCYRFLVEDDFPKIFSRISSIIRGIGDPLVAVYARAYLSRVGSSLLRGQKDFQRSTLHDYMFTWREFKASGKLAASLRSTGLSEEEYLRLHEPAVDWLVASVGDGADKSTFTQVLGAYRDYAPNTLVLRAILDSFQPQFYHAAVPAVVALIRDANSSNVHRAAVFAALGRQLLELPPPQRVRLAVLNDVWKFVSRVDDLDEYMKCSCVYIDLLLRHYSERELLILLKDMVRHVADADADAVAPHLESALSLLVAGCRDFGAVLTSDSFMALMDALRSRRKTDLCKQLLSNFGRHQKPTNDPVIIHTLFDIARSLHDSLDSLSVDDEVRQISSLICRFIEKIDFGRDLEQQLNLYVDCRAAFVNLDSVKDRLIIAVAALAMKALRLMKGRHTKKTASFVKTCLGYCYITVPSIDDELTRLNLFLLCARVALVNGCLSQTDTCVKAAIGLIPDVPPTCIVDRATVSTEPRLLSFLKSFVAALVVVPGHPEHGPFYLVNGLLNALDRYDWDASAGGLTEVYIALLPLLTAYAQRRLPGRLRGVESNDALYGGNEDYMQALRELTDTVLGRILEQLAELKDSNAERQAQLTLSFIDQLLTCAKLTPPMASMLVRLAKLAADGGGSAAAPRLRRTVLRVRRLAKATAKSKSEEARILQQLSRALAEHL